jgi:4-cresol dehydrogenase (hydroxylating)
MIEAIQAWSDAIGADNVVADGATTSAAATATYQTDVEVPVVLRPGSRDEVRDCMRIANRFGTPVYPVSGGRNYGFGSRAPQRDSALLDLGRMKRIVEYDERLGYVTVEPGVSFAQMHEFLSERGAPFVMTVPSTSPRASLVGHALERGPGRGGYGDRFLHSAAMEVVLPTGECVHTGLDRFEGARAAEVYRHGVGPALDGMFTQANLGVVTRMTFWLAPMPSHSAEFHFCVGGGAALERTIEAARTLTLRQVVGPGTFGLWNRTRLVADMCSVDWSGRDPRHALSEREIERMLAGTLVGRLFGSHEWYGFGRVRAHSAAELNALKAAVRSVLAPAVDRLYVRVPGMGLRLVEARRRARASHSPRELLRLLRERPRPDQPRGEAAARLHRWRKRGLATGDDPDADRCGFIWSTPVVPMLGECVAEAAALARTTLSSHGFDPILEIVPLSDRSVELLTAIVYDRALAGEDERAAACHQELVRRNAACGYLPYRLNHLSMDSLPPMADDYGLLVQRLKGALDPADVLAPGRYDFRSEWRARPDARRHVEEDLVRA